MSPKEISEKDMQDWRDDLDNGRDKPAPTSAVAVRRMDSMQIAKFLESGAVWHSFDLSKPEQARQLFRARTGKDADTKSIADRIIQVSNIVIWKGEEEEYETGETTIKTRVVLIGPEGFRVSVGSPSAVRSLIAMVQCFGPPPYNPPMKIRAVRTPCGNGKEWVSFDLAE